MSANRVFAVVERTAGILQAGIYKCSMETSGDLNEETLLSDLMDRAGELANSMNGVEESRILSNPTPSRIQFTTVFAFLNLDSMIYFAQIVPFPQRTRAIEYKIDYGSLIALI